MVISNITVLNSFVSSDASLVEVVKTVNTLVATLQALGGIAIIWIAVNIRNWWVGKKRDKVLGEIQSDIRKIKRQLKK